MNQPKTILLLSGLSGAGKTTALKTLEDMGWEVVDNLPLVLLDRLLDTPLPEGHAGEDARPLALGIDARTRGFDAAAIVQRIKANGTITPSKRSSSIARAASWNDASPKPGDAIRWRSTAPPPTASRANGN
jgi:P-loop ATPase protein family